MHIFPKKCVNSSYVFSEKFRLCFQGILHTPYDTVQKATEPTAGRFIPYFRLLDNLSQARSQICKALKYYIYIYIYT